MWNPNTWNVGVYKGGADNLPSREPYNQIIIR